jgi:hypothetical protein
MKMKKSILVVGAVLFLAGSLFGQEVNQPSGPPECRLVFLRPGGHSEGVGNPIVFLDGAPLAKLTKGKYFAVVIPADQWVTAQVRQAGTPSAEFQIKPVPGRTIFIRLFGPGWGRGGLTGSLIRIDGSDIQKAMKKLVPEERKNVHAEDRVLLDVVTMDSVRIEQVAAK